MMKVESKITPFLIQASIIYPEEIKENAGIPIS